MTRKNCTTGTMGWKRCHLIHIVCALLLVGFFVVHLWIYEQQLEDQINVMNWTGEKTTLVTMAYNSKRRGNWKVMLESYCRMDDIFDKILFIWQNVSAPCPEFQPCEVDVQCLATKQNSMNNRYYFREHVQTRTTFSVDDDVIVPRDLVIKLLRRSFQSDLVGLDTRSFGSDGTYSFWGFTYPNKMVLPKTWVLPVRYWDLYWQDEEILRFIDSGNACEDLAMNFVVRNYTQENPAFVYGSFFGQQRQVLKEAGGLSIIGDRWNWGTRRTFCVRWLLQHFPLALVE